MKGRLLRSLLVIMSLVAIPASAAKPESSLVVVVAPNLTDALEAVADQCDERSKPIAEAIVNELQRRLEGRFAVRIGDGRRRTGREVTLTMQSAIRNYVVFTHSTPKS